MESLEVSGPRHDEGEQASELGEEQPEFFDFEPLPALLEDEENVSLADILSLRESCLTERDIWAICLECCYSMKEILHSALFQTLCITPDTLAFNTNGSVCFMEPLSDDPEGDFVPPEFDITGNTIEAHVYSLGATLQAAIEYVVDPEVEPEISRNVWILLEHMQDPIPSNRPDIESVISLCEERMDYCSSLNICRSLSAIGRRVLSIESVAAFQDGCEHSWRGKIHHESLPNEKIPASTLSAAKDLQSNSYHSNRVNGLVEHNEQEESGLKEVEINDERTCHLQFPNWSKKSEMEIVSKKDNGASYLKKDTFCVNESCPPEDQRVYQCERRVLDKRNACTFQSKLPEISRNRKKVLLRKDLLLSSCIQEEKEHSDFNELLLDQPTISMSSLIFNEIHESSGLASPRTSAVVQKILTSNNEKVESLPHHKPFFKSPPVWDRIVEPADNEQIITRNCAPLENSVQTLTLSDDASVSLMNEKTLPLVVSPGRIQFEESHLNPQGAGNSPCENETCKEGLMSKSTIECEQWTSLKDLLLWHGKPLKDDELWALCHECLFTLQTYIEFPAYLCMDSVIIDSHGEILFVAPKEKGDNDTLCVPPEFGEQGFVTEKACVYGVAAILWTAAKCNSPIQEKLALPKKLKRLLLSMAKRNYEDRPSLDDALKMCREYLIQENQSSRNILAELSKCAHQIIPNDSHGEHLLSLLQNLTSHKSSSASPGSSLDERRDEEETKSLYSFCFKVSEDNISRKSFNWKIPKGTLNQKDKQYTIAAALPRPCYTGDLDEFSGSYVKAEDRGSHIFSDYSVQQMSQQLTLLQEDLFKNCHPVNLLNSRSFGVGAKPSIVLKSFSTESLVVDGGSLFQPNCIQNKYLVHVLRFAENVSTWVAAEIVSSHNLKLQVNLLSTFLLIGKSCYEHRDFGTAMQILAGLDNLIVRQLPAWKNLSSKVSEILDELKALEVFLKSDNLCLMEGDRFRTLPTIPSAHVLAMHVQQLETGGFTMANGAYKWKKLRNIARVVSQVHAFQEIPYTFTPDPELQFYLKQRIHSFSEADITALAASNTVNFYQTPADRHSRKLHDALRRVKATFQ
ncbi:kinase non-catalytic C-lobe domain-containing protein 1 [Lissotriton helveticus]